MMKRAGRVHGLRGLGLAIAAVIGAVVVLDVRRRVDEDKQATIADNLVQRSSSPRRPRSRSSSGRWNAIAAGPTES